MRRTVGQAQKRHGCQLRVVVKGQDHPVIKANKRCLHEIITELTVTVSALQPLKHLGDSEGMMKRDTTLGEPDCESAPRMDEAGATPMKPAARSDTEAEPVKWDVEKQLGVSGSRRISWVSPGSESFFHPASGLADPEERLTDAADSNQQSRKQNQRKHKQGAAMSK
eukprot:2223060-Rhodomonas_salina.1